MTNTIPNVPRELLERLHSYIPNGDGHNSQYANDLADAVVALEGFAAPSPAGVDGLEVVGTLRYFMDYPDSPHSAPGYITHQFNPASWDHAGEAAGEHKLCRLSDAQAIIDGLRGEVAQFKATISDSESVFVNMMRGIIAKPSLRSMVNLYFGEVLNGEDALQLELAKANAERDQQAQRIGELDGLLREVRDTYRAAIHWEDLRSTMKRIDVALPAVCAAAPNIAATSEHNADLRT